MTTPNRFAVPLDVLESIHVGVAEQVQEEPAVAQQTDPGRWGGGLVPAYGDGGGGGCAADGE